MKIRDMVLGGFFIALGIILPMVFHSFGAAGNVFLPMHIPVFLAGFFLGKKFGVVVGTITPILSSIITGMPVILPMLPIMIFELGTYGFISGYFRKDRRLGIVPSLIISMLLGRLSATLVVLVLVEVVKLNNYHVSPLKYFGAIIVTGLPGIAVQICIIPFLLKRLHEGYLKFKEKNKK